ncbi:MAG: UDP-N-acetylmuramoyl-tripeptide--D-alanyl-D-alanine ligase [Pseudonocardiales bacterium]|nr:UDP-N-acetylmuramoyl-tripeptide--D-alanyl-D-alanine ligase [Pseudonocardiales bacterium]
MTIGAIAAVVSGEVVGLAETVVVTGKVEFDSRRVLPGDLFLAFVGDHLDGHDFARQALDAGAVAVMSTRPLPTGSVVVSDPIEAITALADHVGHRLSATIIGVTGSSGKTSTKDLLAYLLQPLGRTIATPESFNNELGHPYTVLLADADTEFLVLETSARGVGHIAHLTEIAPPRIGVVLNVGSAHLGEFGSVAAIASAKGELIEALPPATAGGVAVLNADDPLVLAMAGRTQARVVTFGEHLTADVRAEQVRIDDSGRPAFELVAAGQSAPVQLALYGEHHVANSLAAAAVALECGMPLSDVAAALSNAEQRSKWRMEVADTADGVTVINDAYNANPESMRAALKTLAIMSRGRRSVAVLGHMGELGSESTAEHDALGRLVVRYDIGKVIAVGDEARPIAHGAALEGSWNGESEWVSDTDAATARLAGILEPGDVVLVKGSRSAGMERVAAGIMAARGTGEGRERVG